MSSAENNKKGHKSRPPSLKTETTETDIKCQPTGNHSCKDNARTAPGYLSYEPRGRGKGFESPSDWIERLSQYQADINPEYRMPAALVDMNPSEKMTRTGLHLLHFVLATHAHANSKTVSIKKGVLAEYLSITTPRVVDAVKLLDECRVIINANSVKAGSKAGTVGLFKSVSINRYDVQMTLAPSIWSELRDPRFFAFVDLQVVRKLKSADAIILSPLSSLLSRTYKDARFKVNRQTDLQTGRPLRGFEIDIWPSELSAWLGFDAENKKFREPARLIRTVKAADKKAKTDFNDDPFGPSFQARLPLKTEPFRRDLRKTDKTILKLKLRPAERNAMFARMEKKTFEQFNIKAPSDLYFSPKRFLSILEAVNYDVSERFIEQHMTLIQNDWKCFVVDKHKSGVEIEPAAGPALISEFFDGFLTFGPAEKTEQEVAYANEIFEDLVFGRLQEFTEEPVEEESIDYIIEQLFNNETRIAPQKPAAKRRPARAQRKNAAVFEEFYRIDASYDGINVRFEDLIFHDIKDPGTGKLKREHISISDIAAGKYDPSKYAFRELKINDEEYGLFNKLEDVLGSLRERVN